MLGSFFLSFSPCPFKDQRRASRAPSHLRRGAPQCGPRRAPSASQPPHDHRSHRGPPDHTEGEGECGPTGPTPQGRTREGRPYWREGTDVWETTRSATHLSSDTGVDTPLPRVSRHRGTRFSSSMKHAEPGGRER